MSWLWLWTDILDSEKVDQLDDVAFRGWVLFLACAKRHNSNGELPAFPKLRHWCRRPEAMVKNWLLMLTGAELLERNGEVYTVHDWDTWQPEHSWKTPAERSRDYRDRQKTKRHAETPSTLPLEEKNRIEESIVRDAYISSCDASRDAIPPPPTPLIPSLKEARKRECIDQAAQHWGAACGDIQVAELLKVFEPETVMEAMDAYFLDHGRDFKPRLLKGYCRTQLEKSKKGIA